MIFCILPKSLVEEAQGFANSQRNLGHPPNESRRTQERRNGHSEGTVPLVL
jgi:hypothetical protein